MTRALVNIERRSEDKTRTDVRTQGFLEVFATQTKNNLGSGVLYEPAACLMVQAKCWVDVLSVRLFVTTSALSEALHFVIDLCGAHALHSVVDPQCTGRTDGGGNVRGIRG